MSALSYRAELRVPRHMASFLATQRFLATACESLGVPERSRLDLELAVEEGFMQLFSQVKLADEDEPIRIRLEFCREAVRIAVLAPGRPVAGHFPVYRLRDDSEDSIAGLGSFLMRSRVDEVQWRYVEKEGQELSLVKVLPSPILSLGEDGGAPRPAETTPAVGEIVCRRLLTREEALAVAICAYDIYRYAYKDVIYYPEELLERNESGLMRSWIARDEAGTVFGHYAMMKKKADSRVAEMGAAFVRPECRRGGVFNALSEAIHEDAARSGLLGLFSLSVTNHVATQKISERNGRRSVGIRLASSPAVFVEGARPGDRVTTVLNYRPLGTREPRRIFPPEPYREMILRSYGWLELPVRVEGPALGVVGEDRVECDRDLTWNRAVLEARGGDTARHKLRAYTELLLEQSVACLVLSLDLEDPGTPALAEEAARMGYVYSGIFPDSMKWGSDALQLQLLNGIRLDPEEIRLHQESAREILDFIRREAPGLFAGGEGAR